MSYSFFMSVFDVLILILLLVKLRPGVMRHLISTFTAQDQIRGADTLLEPHGVTGPITWTVSWGFTHPRLVCNIDPVERGSAGLSCTVLLLNMM